jgi:anti-sigma factor RsiW
MIEPMNEMTVTHLTDDQIDEAMIGGLDAATSARLDAHLDACTQCAARLAEAEMPLASFKAVSAAWSERRSATMPAVLPQRLGMGARGRLMAWSTALSVMIAAGVAIPAMLHTNQHAVGSAQGSRSVTVPVLATTEKDMEAAGGPVASNAGSALQPDSLNDSSSQDRISQDNAMLMDIDRELDATTATPAVLTLESPHGPLARPRAVNE